MSAGIYAALSGAIAQQTALEHTATNLANADTTGYRSIKPVFHEVMAQETEAGEPVRFSSVRRTAVSTAPGAIVETGRPLDVALGPETFLAVEAPGGERFTRAGALGLRPDGTLTTRSGQPVLDAQSKKPIVVDATQPLSIDAQGQVLSNGEPVGILRLVEFDRPEELTPEGATLLAGSAESGEARASAAPISVGALEQSNASPVTAVHDMMAATRMFDAMERAITTFKSIDQRLVTTVPKGA